MTFGERSEEGRIAMLGISREGSPKMVLRSQNVPGASSGRSWG